jgi:G2/mitotic-specific cyclin 1/2
MSNYPLRNRNGSTVVTCTDDKENTAANLISNLKDGHHPAIKEANKPKGKPAKGKLPPSDDPMAAGGKREARKPLGAKDNVPNLHATKENATTKVTKPKETKLPTKKSAKNVPTITEQEDTISNLPELREPQRRLRSTKPGDGAKLDLVRPEIPPESCIAIDEKLDAVEADIIAAAYVATDATGQKLEVVKATVVAEAYTAQKSVVPVQSHSDAAAPEKSQPDWEDLDADDVHDPVMVSEYVVEIFEYMRQLELRTLAEANYMEHQHEITWQMRSILVDWIVDVHNKFRLLPETLYLTVNLIDRFLSARVVSLSKLQLVGITALFIAAKYEEIVAPSIENLLYMAENGYSTDEVVRAERYVLGSLEFSIQYQSPMSFLRRGSKADNYDIQTRTLAKYLMEVSIVDHRFLVCPPSEIAAAGLYLARRMLERGDWDLNLIHYSGYSEEQLAACANLMIDFLSHPTQHDAVYRKYSGKKFMKASVYVRDWIESHPNAQVVAQSTLISS